MSTSATLQPGQPATVVIDGRSDIFSSGMAKAFTERGGRLPALLTLASGGGHVTFSNVKGASGCVAGAAVRQGDRRVNWRRLRATAALTSYHPRRFVTEHHHRRGDA